MNDPGPSRIELLRFARRVVVQQAKAALSQLDRWIADEERREAERQRGVEARPPEPHWLIEQNLSGRTPVYVHVGGCHMTGKRSKGATREQALRALTDRVDPCPHCRPDTELGLLD
ncbi:hypothetical protein J7F01_39995 [Streptomyces sp. ISL-22]|uniref:Uncharacterized protein n=1 Tax=Streptomyces curacoi TaxID=146536 RepID=A0A124GX95_9ACTN|nr:MULTISPECIES: DUF6233 domain-containing protein [Streptomyces]KUM70713.1 hypothetical protein AQI70_28615 [Streptomyces curacoi]MBT2417544.1 hypothetical protein [Streptomyces sp. ISL-24]MBT2438202.1 hypothetical protein [Streptomyces sp. ISL-22]